MVPLLPKIVKPNFEESSIDSETLLNKFLVKNDLKFLENYLSLQEDTVNLAQETRDAATNFIYRRNVQSQGGISNDTSNDSQASLDEYEGQESDEFDNDFVDITTENNETQFYIKSNDLLIYYYIFNYFVWTNKHKLNTHDLGEFSPIFQELINFSNSQKKNIVESVNDDNNSNTTFNNSSNIDDFDYESLMKNAIHCKLKQITESNPINKIFAVHLIVKKYDTLDFQNLNYMMYLLGGYKPANHSQKLNFGESDSDIYKKLKSCSRCRKNKIKCDSIKKYPYSCSNCFKKNMNFLKNFVKRSQNHGAHCHENDANYITNMARSSSNLTTTSNSSLGNGSVSSNSSHDECSCDSKKCLSKENARLLENEDLKSMTNLKVFLKLFNIEPHHEIDDLSTLKHMAIPRSPSNLRGQNENFMVCKIQMISTNLIFKKKSLKKNYLIKSLNNDIQTLKRKLDEMIVMEERILDLKKDESLPSLTYKNDSFDSDGSITQSKISKLLEIKNQWYDTHGDAKRRKVLSTNELLVLNNITPVKTPENEKYFTYLEKNFKSFVDGAYKDTEPRTEVMDDEDEDVTSEVLVDIIKPVLN